VVSLVCLLVEMEYLEHMLGSPLLS
jgi:hypothetical protein